MNDDDTEQAWWDADLQRERADEEAFWAQFYAWLAESKALHDRWVVESNQRERSVWHVDDI